MKLIHRKKTCYPPGPALADYLATFGRWRPLPVGYDDLLRYDQAVALCDGAGRDTLWSTVAYPPGERAEIEDGLLETYAILKAAGDRSVMDHLVVDRIDQCLYGNSRPFRARILNTLNENFDYFHVKRADASRLYGLELEHVLSPNRIAFLCDAASLVEEHIPGVPGDALLDRLPPPADGVSAVRLAKEFVKFNERCYLRLLGDMHAGNFVVDVTLDLEANNYRIRAVDFDQQCHEPRRRVYQPQHFPENRPYVALATRCLTAASVRQYQREERALLRRRMTSSAVRLGALLGVMRAEELAPAAAVAQLAAELAEHRHDAALARCRTMGELVAASLASLDAGS